MYAYYSGNRHGKLIVVDLYFQRPVTWYRTVDYITDMKECRVECSFQIIVVKLFKSVFNLVTHSVKLSHNKLFRADSIGGIIETDMNTMLYIADE